jgi:hypothetical protein
MNREWLEEEDVERFISLEEEQEPWDFQLEYEKYVDKQEENNGQK